MKVLVDHAFMVQISDICDFGFRLKIAPDWRKCIHKEWFYDNYCSIFYWSCRHDILVQFEVICIHCHCIVVESGTN
jgi:hypothetical protein